MPLCPNGNPTIEWQYSGEEKNRIIGANDYTTEIVEDLSQNTFYRFVYRASTLSNGVITWGNEVVRLQADKFNGIDSWRLKVRHKNVFSYPVDNKFTTYVYVPATGKYDSAPINDRNADFYVEVVSQGVTTTIYIGGTSGLWGLRFQPSDVTLRKQNYVFKVFNKNGQVVYSKIKPVAPVVTHFCGEQCPPGTCECVNGSTVCCYDTSTGKAVKSFTR